MGYSVCFDVYRATDTLTDLPVSTRKGYNFVGWFTAKSGGGVVTAVVNGNKELTKLTIDPDAVDPDDVEMLEDLVIAAVNEALRMYEAESEATVNKLTGGMNLGGLGF